MKPALFTLLFLSLTACSPKVYLKDRQTILEEEAAGEWPEFEKSILEKTKAPAPTPYPKAENSAEKNRLYNVLNGELTTQSSRKTSSAHASTQ